MVNLRFGGGPAGGGGDGGVDTVGGGSDLDIHDRIQSTLLIYKKKMNAFAIFNEKPDHLR
jgi:hypothetical protein